MLRTNEKSIMGGFVKLPMGTKMGLSLNKFVELEPVASTPKEFKVLHKKLTETLKETLKIESNEQAHKIFKLERKISILDGLINGRV